MSRGPPCWAFSHISDVASCAFSITASFIRAAMFNWLEVGQMDFYSECSSQQWKVVVGERCFRWEYQSTKQPKTCYKERMEQRRLRLACSSPGFNLSLESQWDQLRETGEGWAPKTHIQGVLVHETWTNLQSLEKPNSPSAARLPSEADQMEILQHIPEIHRGTTPTFCFYIHTAFCKHFPQKSPIDTYSLTAASLCCSSAVDLMVLASGSMLLLIATHPG